MKLLLDIKDDKAIQILDLLKNYSFVESQQITPYKANILKDLGKAIKEVNEVKKGKNKSKPLNKFLNEI